MILFLIWDILAQAVEPWRRPRSGHGDGPTSDFVVNLLAFGLSLAFGLLSLVWFAQRMRADATTRACRSTTSRSGRLSGSGSNFSEGLAIGQSAATATAFA